MVPLMSEFSGDDDLCMDGMNGACLAGWCTKDYPTWWCGFMENPKL